MWSVRCIQPSNECPLAPLFPGYANALPGRGVAVHLGKPSRISVAVPDWDVPPRDGNPGAFGVGE